MNPSTSVRMPGGEKCEGGLCSSVRKIIRATVPTKKRYNIGKVKVKPKEEPIPAEDVDDTPVPPKKEKMGIKVVEHSAGTEDKITHDTDDIEMKEAPTEKIIDKKVNPKVKKILNAKPKPFYQKMRL